jgi:hypothetical protein
VEEGAHIAEVGPAGAKRLQPLCDEVGLLDRRVVTVGHDRGRLDQTAEDGVWILALHVAAAGSQDEASGPAGRVGGGIDQRRPSRSPGPLDGDTGAGHLQGATEDGLELGEELTPLEQAWTLVTPGPAIGDRRFPLG